MEVKMDENLFNNFENTKDLQTINKTLIQSSTCTIDNTDFGMFLGSLFSFSNPLISNDEDKHTMRFILIVYFGELEITSTSMKNLRNTGESDTVIEMITYASISYNIDYVL